MFNFKKFPTIQTQRLILRQLILADTDGIFAIRSNYEVTKYNSGAAYQTKSQAEDLITGIQAEYDEHKAVRWGITLKPDDTVIGMTGFNYWHQVDNRASIGFDLAQVHWRKGIMREAVTAMINFGFTEMKLHRIEADASIYNTASIGLLTSLGFQQEGLQREQYYEDDAYHDLAIFALLEGDWHIK